MINEAENRLPCYTQSMYYVARPVLGAVLPHQIVDTIATPTGNINEKKKRKFRAKRSEHNSVALRSTINTVEYREPEGASIFLFHSAVHPATRFSIILQSFKLHIARPLFSLRAGLFNNQINSDGGEKICVEDTCHPTTPR